MSSLENSGPQLPNYRQMVGGKIHRATVTAADLHYVGSVTVDEDLLEAANILAGQQVDIVDVTNGARLTTYTIAGPRGGGDIKINGAAAHLVKPGDVVIIMAYQLMPEGAARQHTPAVVMVDTQNRILETGNSLSNFASHHGALTGGASPQQPLRRSDLPSSAAD